VTELADENVIEQTQTVVPVLRRTWESPAGSSICASQEPRQEGGASSPFKRVAREALGGGDPRVIIAVLDGPVDRTHECFQGAQLKTLQTLVDGDAGDGNATAHGTHVASIIFGQRGSCIEGIAPRCRGLIIPIFGDSRLSCSQLDLARAIMLAVAQGAHIVNISGGQLAQSGEPLPLLSQAIDLCQRRNVLIVAAAGNDGCNCLHIPAASPSVLAVGAMDEAGSPLRSSNWSEAYQDHGILAPGASIQGAAPGGHVVSRSGTSFATPLISGLAALLLSSQLRLGIEPDPHAIRQCLLETAFPCTPLAGDDCQRMLAGRVNIRGAVDHLPLRGALAMSETTLLLEEKLTAENSANSVPRPPLQEDVIVPSDCGCGCGGKAKAACNCAGRDAAPSEPQLVYAIGTLNWDFGTATREDSFRQAMSDPSLTLGRPQPSPRSVDDLVKFLKTDVNASYAQALMWTLNLDATPIYAIQPAGAFASDAYKVLISILEDKTAPLMSVPGYIAGSARLQTGQQVPILVPALRGLLNWNIDALALHAIGKAPAESRPAKDREAYAKKHETLKDFVSRIYYELRNLGILSQDRALNFAATNAVQAAKVIDDAASKNLSLDRISVSPSGVCRPGSDCYDVDVTFFDPTNMNVANTIYRFTLDVSDVIPVSVGDMRSWTRRS
jgi:hypothetical protein